MAGLWTRRVGRGGEKEEECYKEREERELKE